MSTTNRATTLALAAGAVVLTSVAGYAIWFDYRRQTDKDFRRKISEYARTLSKEGRGLKGREEREAREKGEVG